MEKLLKVTRPYIKGDDVRAVQKALDKLGFDTGNIDGIYGPKTAAAVTAFQKASDIKVDGIVGPQTWNVLFNWPETEHFKLCEFKCRDGSDVPYEYYGNLKKLTALLEKIRSACGDKPMVITSGYRTPTYNKKVGGATRSQHLYAAAADVITPKGMKYDEFYKICDELNPDGGVGNYPNRFVHVDVRGKRARW